MKNQLLQLQYLPQLSLKQTEPNEEKVIKRMFKTLYGYKDDKKKAEIQELRANSKNRKKEKFKKKEESKPLLKKIKAIFIFLLILVLKFLSKFRKSFKSLILPYFTDNKLYALKIKTA